jgi:hypothetical protein
MGRRSRQGERSAAHISVYRYLGAANWISCRVEAKSEVGVEFGVETFFQDGPFSRLCTYPVRLNVRIRRGGSRGRTYRGRRKGGVDQTPEQ